MKVIVSHDVDHFCLGEHWRDTFIPGLAWRSMKSCIRGELPLSCLVKRFSWQVNRIQKLHSYNQTHGLPATYFFGMRNGLNLSYHWKAAKKHVRFLRQANIDIGLHGMAYDDESQLREEKERLEELLDSPVEGIRNHYLRLADSTLENMNRVGFKYDSTHSGLELPFKSGELIEIPISIMDVQLIQKGRHPRDLDLWMDESWSRIQNAEEKNLPYFVINFHDMYYSDGWPMFQSWYERFTQELKKRHYEFVSFGEALSEFEF